MCGHVLVPVISKLFRETEKICFYIIVDGAVKMNHLSFQQFFYQPDFLQLLSLLRIQKFFLALPALPGFIGESNPFENQLFRYFFSFSMTGERPLKSIFIYFKRYLFR